MRTSVVACCALVWVAACSGGPARGTSPLVRGLEGADSEVRASCRVAAKKCVRCHSVERIVRLHVVSPVHWQRYVNRMRMQPDSGIGPKEGEQITECLVYRRFGAGGLAKLRSGQGDRDF